MNSRKHENSLSPLDPWAAIGQGAGIMHATDRRPFPPPPVTRKDIAWEHGGGAKAPSPMKKMSSPKDLETKVAQLKKYYLPFLRDTLPEKTAGQCDGAIHQTIDRMWFKYIDTPRINPVRIAQQKDGWEEVGIPDVRGPAGKWYGVYTTTFKIDQALSKWGRLFIRFESVDYRCEVFLNGRFIAQHESHLVPFEIDISDSVSREEENRIIVKIENDFADIAGGSRTGNGIGWDAPLGWGHAPSGAGIYGPVRIFGRNEVAITDIFVRPDINRAALDIWIEVENKSEACSIINAQGNTRLVPPSVQADFRLRLFPCNFDEKDDGQPLLDCKLRGGNISGEPDTFKYTISVEGIDIRLWECNSPYLYSAIASCTVQGESAPRSQRRADFGYRTFESRENETPKGKLYLNNRKIFLRGASTIGHFEWDLCSGHPGQVVEDILIAKAANVNFFRTGPAPLDYFDRLGILCQSRLPMCTGISRNSLPRVCDMACTFEKTWRNHPSLITLEFINEPDSDPRQINDKVGQKMLQNDEMEEFFLALRSLVRIHNPDRVIKAVEGVDSCEYVQERDTPFGLQDVHYYTFWYGPFAAGFGGLYAGNLYSIKEGWAASCGEYGAEALDSLDTMRNGTLWDIRYPREWVPRSADDTEWKPGQINLCQQEKFGFNWYDIPRTAGEWIERSQKHQAFATRILTEALRLRMDIIQSTAVHILIDAFPAGWLKALVSFDRTPKPAYYAFADALEPVAVNIRAPQWHYLATTRTCTELWIFNDTDTQINDHSLEYYFIDGSSRESIAEGKISAFIPASRAAYQGTFAPPIPAVESRTTFEVYAVLKNSDGKAVHDYTLEITAHPDDDLPSVEGVRIGIIAETSCALLDEYMRIFPWARRIGHNADMKQYDVLIVATPGDLEKNRKEIVECVSSGTGLYLMEQRKAASWNIPEFGIEAEVVHNSKRRDYPGSWGGHKALDFISRDTGHWIVNGFAPEDFSYWYSGKYDRKHYMTRYFLKCKTGKAIPVLRSKDFLICAEVTAGKGRIIVNELCLEGRLECHPCARKYIARSMEYLAGAGS